MGMELLRTEVTFLKAWGAERTLEECAAAIRRSPEYTAAAGQQLGITFAKPKKKPEPAPAGGKKPPKAAGTKQAGAQARFEGKNGLPYRLGPAPPLRPPQPLVRRLFKFDWSPDMDRIVTERYEDLTNDEIAVLMNLPRHAVEDRAKRLKLRKPANFRSRLRARRGSIMAIGLRDAARLMAAGDRGQALIVLDEAIKKARG